VSTPPAYSLTRNKVKSSQWSLVIITRWVLFPLRDMTIKPPKRWRHFEDDVSLGKRTARFQLMAKELYITQLNRAMYFKALLALFYPLTLKSRLSGRYSQKFLQKHIKRLCAEFQSSRLFRRLKKQRLRNDIALFCCILKSSVRFSFIFHNHKMLRA